MKETKSNNNSPRRTILWGIAGAYVLYLGIDLLKSYFSGDAATQKDVLLCTIGGGAFAVIGVVLLALALRQGLRAIKEQAAEFDRVEAEEAEERARLEDGGDEEDPQA